MAAAPSIAGGATATLAGVAAGAAIGGTTNVIVQRTLDGKQEMSTVDVLVAIATGAATQGRGIVATTATTASGAALGATIKGTNPIEAATSAGAGSVVGTGVANMISKSTAPLINNVLTSEIAGSIGAALTTEVVTNRIDKNLATEKDETTTSNN
ncbi:hypothetical protein [Pandoraea eparura]|jgi:filamentous hemagglutinin|uniref:hypothetical protein n=1 Tax=Pandoraea eparura TaxID=2508291 RepID=UPI001242D93F|nr:hypothetical protein [Pandoraea eparura]